MPGPQTPAVASVVLPPISGTPIVDQNGVLTVAGLNLIQQIWAGVFGTGGVATNYPQPGDLKPIGGSGSQAGWLLCDGTAYNQAQYTDLFAAIGTAWGTSGPGTFRVPNLKGNFIIGADGTHALGTTGGALSRTITQANLPAYELTVTDPGHDHPGGSTPTTTNTVGTDAGTSTSANTGTASTGITVDSGGSGTPLDTTPTFAAVNWLIKT